MSTRKMKRTSKYVRAGYGLSWFGEPSHGEFAAISCGKLHEMAFI